MVVLHEPPRQRVRSTSPLVPLHRPQQQQIDEDLIKLTPPRINSSGTATTQGRPPSSISLHHRLQASLQLVAASPSSKFNAPDPFRPSRELPRETNATASTSGLANRVVVTHQESIDEVSVEEEEAEDAQVTSTVDNNNLRNYEIAAKALFGEKPNGRPLNSRRSSPPRPTFRAITASPSPPKTKGHASRASLPDVRMYASQPLLTPSHSLAGRRQHASPTIRTTSPQAPASPSRLLTEAQASIPTLAKIGRLNAEIATLRSDYEISQSELRSVEEKYAHLTERLTKEASDKNELLQRLAGHEELATEFETYIADHEELRARNDDLEEQHANDLAESERMKDLFRSIKWKERKLKNELVCRRAEEQWRESAVFERSLDELECDRLDLQLEITDLKLKHAAAENARDWWKDLYDYEMEQRRLSVNSTHHLESELEDVNERLSNSVITITKLTVELDAAVSQLTASQLASQQLHQSNAELVKRLKAAEQAVQQNDEQELKEMKRKLKEADSIQRRTESQCENLRNDKEDLEASLKDRMTEIALLNSKLREMDNKLESSHAEIDNLQSLVSMQSRATKVFGSGDISSTQTLAKGPVQSKTTALKARRRTPETNSPLPQDLGDNENHYSLPPPAHKDSAAKAAPTALTDESDSDADQADTDVSSIGREGKRMSQAARKSNGRALAVNSDAVPSKVNKGLSQVARRQKDIDDNAAPIGSSDASDSDADDTDVDVPSVGLKSKGESQAARKSSGRPTAINGDELTSKAKKRSKQVADGAEDDDKHAMPPMKKTKGVVKASLMEKSSNRSVMDATRKESMKNSGLGRTVDSSKSLETKKQKEPAVKAAQKKIALHASRTPFVWTGIDGFTGTKNALGIPDVLSPIKRR